MFESCLFDYAVIRVVPRVEREEFINVGIILSCPARKFLDARIELDAPKLKAFAPTLEPDAIQNYLSVIPKSVLATRRREKSGDCRSEPDFTG